MTWFENLVGFPEEDGDQVRENLTIDKDGKLTSLANNRTFAAGKLTTPSLAELRSITASLENQDSPLQVSEVVCDVQTLHQMGENNGALFQVASQFNLLEMVGPGATPERGVGIYEQDRTQGPACAIACGAGTIFRNYLVPLEDQTGQTETRQIDCSADLGRALGNVDESLWFMKNGYLLASQTGLESIRVHLESCDETARDELRSTLRIGLQSDTEVTLGGSGNLVTQAYCSAVPVSYSQWSGTQWEPLARLILEATYEATFHAAVQNYQATHNPRLFLTLIGGSAFGNLLYWILEAIERSLNQFSNCGLDVRLVSYGYSSPYLQALAGKYPV